MLSGIKIWIQLFLTPTVTKNYQNITVIAFGKPNNPNLTPCKNLFKTFIAQSLKEIRWADILFRKIRFFNYPPKTARLSTTDQLKITISRALCLNIRAQLIIASTLESFLSNREGNKIFIDSAQIGKLLEIHHPRYDINLLKYSHKANRARLICLAFWLNRKRLRSNSTSTAVFINPSNIWPILAYRYINPNRRIIVRFHDVLSINGEITPLGRTANSIKQLLNRGIVNSIECYSRENAKSFDIQYRANGINPESLAQLQLNHRTAFIRFIGGGNSRRLSKFLPLRKEIAKLYPKIDLWIEQKILGLNDSIPYPKFLQLESESEIFLDLYRLDQEEGFSYRIPEALFLNRKIITDRIWILEEPFYSPSRIFVIGIDDPKNLQKFLESDIQPLKPEILAIYDSRNYWS